MTFNAGLTKKGRWVRKNETMIKGVYLPRVFSAADDLERVDDNEKELTEKKEVCYVPC